MKKLFFAVIAAAFVFVSANNVFASNKMISTSAYEPTDTVAPADSTVEGTAISSQASVEDSAKQKSTEQTVADKAVEQQAVAE